MRDDIAIIRICGYEGEHSTISLPEQGATQSFDSFWVYGWGEQAAYGAGSYPDILRWVSTPTVSFDTCDSNYNLASIGYSSFANLYPGPKFGHI